MPDHPEIRDLAHVPRWDWRPPFLPGKPRQRELPLSVEWRGGHWFILLDGFEVVKYKSRQRACLEAERLRSYLALPCRITILDKIPRKYLDTM
jgi:hypothetical protein